VWLIDLADLWQEKELLFQHCFSTLFQDVFLEIPRKTGPYLRLLPRYVGCTIRQNIAVNTNSRCYIFTVATCFDLKWSSTGQRYKINERNTCNCNYVWNWDVNIIISLKYKSLHQIRLCKIKVNNDCMIVLKCSCVILSYLDVLDER